MNTEELLKPRYKVIAPIPFCFNKVGDILTAEENQSVKVKADNVDFEGYLFPKTYPTLFKRIHWSDNRDASEMPPYVRYDNNMVNNNGMDKDLVMKVYSARNCNPGGSMAGMIELIVDEYDKMDYTYSHNVLPATLEEYTSFINNQTK